MGVVVDAQDDLVSHGVGEEGELVRAPDHVPEIPQSPASVKVVGHCDVVEVFDHLDVQLMQLGYLLSGLDERLR